MRQRSAFAQSKTSSSMLRPARSAASQKNLQHDEHELAQQPPAESDEPKHPPNPLRVARSAASPRTLATRRAPKHISGAMSPATFPYNRSSILLLSNLLSQPCCFLEQGVWHTVPIYSLSAVKKAVLCVVIDHSGCLHECVANRRADKFEAVLF
ncbi:hypothetical protein SAMN05216238_10935 [Lentibacillus persicus]|uniref:Uncharacterized protein n=1 Tax=Lentibacillus persicus TaxID=640948 RepID=A0A1I1Y7R4_9BACI|nr:hypothetical protein SAMN05216238_10935 [Lentibacillus persicus]